MTDEQFGLHCTLMREKNRLGGPTITNTDGTIADGEHPWRAAQEIGLHTFLSRSTPSTKLGGRIHQLRISTLVPDLA